MPNKLPKFLDNHKICTYIHIAIMKNMVYIRLERDRMVLWAIWNI